MSERTRGDCTVRSALERLLWTLAAPRRRPRESLVASRDALLATAATTLLLRAVLWDPLDATVADALQRVIVDPVELLVATPFDVLVVQTAAGVVVGLLVGAARAWAYYWQRRRKRAPVVEAWAVGSPVAGFLAGALVVFVAATAGTVGLVLTVLAEPLATAAAPWGGVPHLISYHATTLVVVLGLSVGVASVLAYASAVLASEGVVPLRSVVLGGAAVVAVAAAFGSVAWPDVPLARPAWIGPLLAGYGVGVLLAAVGSQRTGGRGRRRSRSGACGTPDRPSDRF